MFILANLMALLASLGVITVLAAFSGLCYVAYRAQRSPTAHLDDFWFGFRKYFWQGLLITGLNVLFFGVLIVNIQFFSEQQGGLFDLLRALWFGAAFIWITVQLYLFPMLEAMETPNLWRAFQNALVMIAANPLFTFTLWLILLIILAISVLAVVPIVLVTPSVIASILSAAVIDRLEAATTRI
ncbi:MAG: hypothetical protein OHK0023_12760 [Anaerolineae bacterium]